MRKLLFLVISLFLIVRIVSAVQLDNNTIINTTYSNSSITFSIPAECDYIEITSFGILIMNVTTAINSCELINHTDLNRNLDSADFCESIGPISGGGGFTQEPKEEKEVTCGLNSLESISKCIYLSGVYVWPDYPQIGVLILIILNYIILLIIALNKDKFKKLLLVVKVISWIILIILTIIVFIWLFSGCRLQKLGDMGQCFIDFGERIWPAYPKIGTFIFMGLLLLAMIIIIFTLRRRSKYEKKNS